MYNRYMRNDDGTYTRVPEEEPGRRPSQPSPGGGQDRQGGREHASGQDHGGQGHGEEGTSDQRGGPSGQDRRGDRDRGRQEHHSGGSGHWEPPPTGDRPWFDEPPPPTGGRFDGLTGFLRHFLDQWHLDSVDTGDLLLLGLLFFLFREDADEELLVALGLLLIL